MTENLPSMEKELHIQLSETYKTPLTMIQTNKQKQNKLH